MTLGLAHKGKATPEIYAHALTLCLLFHPSDLNLVSSQSGPSGV